MFNLIKAKFLGQGLWLFYYLPPGITYPLKLPFFLIFNYSLICRILSKYLAEGYGYQIPYDIGKKYCSKEIPVSRKLPFHYKRQSNS